jgi:hypothetical protein
MNCSACGQRLAEETKFCPHCGHRTDTPIASSPTSTPPPPAVPQQLPKKSKKPWIIGGIVLFVLVGMLINSKSANHESATSAPSDGAKTGAPKGFEPNARERSVLDLLIREDAKTFGDGGEAFIGLGIRRVSAEDVAKAYEENQVAADQAYYGKELLVTGVVASINSGLGNQPYIVFRSPNPFSGPQASFSGSLLKSLTSSPTDPSDVEKRIAGLKKGQKITLVCKGGGSVVGTASFSDCAFADDFGQASANKLKESTLNVLAGREKPSPTTAGLAVTALSFARALPETCFAGNDLVSITGKDWAKCEKVYDQTLTGSNSEEAARAVVEELQAKGIDFSSALNLPQKTK